LKEKRTGTVKFRLDARKQPRLNTRQAVALRGRRVDTSDIPSQGSTGWARPEVLVPTENKLQVTLRIDRDVLVFFRSTGKRYQSRINAVLRQYMDANHKTG
jgi:uncharacterized protein (DUF4415 family)